MAAVAAHDCPLARLFLRARGSLAPDGLARLEEALEQAHRSGETAHPQFGMAAEVFAEHLARVVDDERPEALAALVLADLYWACACLSGNPAALKALRGVLESECSRVLHRLGDCGLEPVDVASRLCAELVVGPGTPLLLRFGGRGSLRSWLRVCIARASVRWVAPERRAVTLEEDLVLAEKSASDPELAALKRRVGGAFQPGFARAVDRLEPQARELLRRHYAEGLGLEDLAREQRVHRVTVSRWLEDARQSLLSALRDVLSVELKVDRLDVDSLLKVMLSDLELSLTALFSGERSHAEPER